MSVSICQGPQWTSALPRREKVDVPACCSEEFSSLLWRVIGEKVDPCGERTLAKNPPGPDLGGPRPLRSTTFP